LSAAIFLRQLPSVPVTSRNQSAIDYFSKMARVAPSTEAAIDAQAGVEAPIADVQVDREKASENVKDQEEQIERLCEHDAVWSMLEFFKPTLGLPLLAWGLVFGGVTPALEVGVRDDTDEAWHVFKACVFVIDVPFFFANYWVGFNVIRGHHQYGGALFSSLLYSTLDFLETTLTKRGGFFSLIGSTTLNMTLLGCWRGQRAKFALQALGMVIFFQIGLFWTGRLFPYLLCMAEDISPYIPPLLHPIFASCYELMFMPLVFKLWASKSRHDTPELVLHWILAVVHSSSEAIFFGGLMHLVARSPDALLPRSAASSILARCASKLFDRFGFYYYFFPWCFGNKMTWDRDLVNRHAHAQSWVGLVFLVLMLPNWVFMLAIEAMGTEESGTVYTRTAFWAIVSVAAVAAVLTEMCVAALTWWQRRECLDADSYWGTFSKMHQPGMQPHFTKFSEFFGKPAERAFEKNVHTSVVTDVKPVVCVPPKHVMIFSALALAYAPGPHGVVAGLTRLGKPC